MNEIAKENRAESYIQRPMSARKKMILDAMGDKEMTTRMVAVALGVTDQNYVRPRMTEMEKEGILEVVGKSYDMMTNRNTSLYRRVK